MKEIRLNLPLTEEAARALRAGDRVLLTGEVYTARDAAHKRLAALLDAGKALPLNLRGQTIYYAGPAPAPPGYACGAAGPTTSSRMDPYTPLLLDRGLRCMIGKGRRSEAVRQAMMAHGAVYLGAVGGAAALIARRIERMECVAYADLGPEAIYRLTVRDFPAIVLMDARGEDLYEIGPARYRQEE